MALLLVDEVLFPRIPRRRFRRLLRERRATRVEQPQPSLCVWKDRAIDRRVRNVSRMEITVWRLLPLRVDVFRQSRVASVPVPRVRVALESLSSVELDVVFLLRLGLFRFPVVSLRPLSAMDRPGKHRSNHRTRLTCC